MDDEQIINSLNHLAEQKYLRVAGRSVCKHAADRIDALVAKLADAERVARYESDVAQQAIDQIKADKARAEAAEARIAHLENHIEAVAKDAHKIMVAYAAPLPAVYRLALGDAAYEVHQECWTDGPAGQIATEALLAEQDATALAIKSIRALPTPTAAELMARINEGEKE